MTQCEAILDFLRQNGGVVTLGEFLEHGRYFYAHKLTARLSELRSKGYNIVCEKKKKASDNLYRLVEESKSQYPQPQYNFDEFGVGSLNL